MSDELDDDAAGREADDLRALWSALPPPQAGMDADGLPSGDTAASDDLTRAAIERLRAAWAAHSVEVPEVPFALRRAHTQRIAPPLRRARTRPALRILAVATAAAAAALMFALRHDRTSLPIERTGEGPFVAGTGDTHVGSGMDEPRELEPSPMPAALVATRVDIPREDFALRADGFEFETQGVRFVLIETTGDADSSAPATKE